MVVCCAGANRNPRKPLWIHMFTCCTHVNWMAITQCSHSHLWRDWPTLWQSHGQVHPSLDLTRFKLIVYKHCHLVS